MHTLYYQDSLLEREDYNFYNDGIVIKDSTIIYNDGEEYVTVYDIFYTDKAIPWFASGYPSVFHKHPYSKGFLINEMIPQEKNARTKYIYSYDFDIGANLFIRYESDYDLYTDSITENVFTMKYYLAFPETNP